MSTHLNVNTLKTLTWVQRGSDSIVKDLVNRYRKKEVVLSNYSKTGIFLILKKFTYNNVSHKSS